MSQELGVPVPLLLPGGEALAILAQTRGRTRALWHDSRPAALGGPEQFFKYKWAHVLIVPCLETLPAPCTTDVIWWWKHDIVA